MMQPDLRASIARLYLAGVMGTKTAEILGIPLSAYHHYVRQMSATDKFYGKALQIMVGPGKAMALTMRLVSLAYWIAMIGAIGWLMSQAFDRQPPVDVLSTEVLTDAVKAGEAIKVRYNLVRHRVCRTETSWAIIDGLGECRRFGPVVVEAVGRVGDDSFTRAWTLPAGAAPGAGRLRIITSWQCAGNFLHGLYPVTRVAADLHFRIVSPADASR